MQTEDTGARAHFDRVPDEWDALYAHEDRRRYLVNRLLRKGLYERYRFTFDQVGDLGGQTVLDVGCGTGRYSVECARRGAAQVVGVDFAPHMIDFARHAAAQHGVADRCEFVCADFLTHHFDDGFDVVLALGLFDYVPVAGPLFAKIAGFEPRAFVASFPKFTPIWGTQRRVRYRWIKKCPVYDYTREQVAGLCRRAGFERVMVVEGRHGLMCAAGRGPFGGVD
jgi:SAM-dependent methyltransferase